jgi:energy-coupling factor transporter transmembrane protein EcfT
MLSIGVPLFLIRGASADRLLALPWFACFVTWCATTWPFFLVERGRRWLWSFVSWFIHLVLLWLSFTWFLVGTLMPLEGEGSPLEIFLELVKNIAAGVACSVVCAIFDVVLQ